MTEELVPAFDQALEGLGEMIATLIEVPDSAERRAFAGAAAMSLLQMAEALCEVAVLGEGDSLRERVAAAMRRRNVGPVAEPF